MPKKVTVTLQDDTTVDFFPASAPTLPTLEVVLDVDTNTNTSTVVSTTTK